MKSFNTAYVALIVVLHCAITVLCHKKDHFNRLHKGAAFNYRHHPQGGVLVHLSEKGTARNETVVIDVNRNQPGADGSETKLKVNLRIHVIQGQIHVNGHKINHAVVTSIHLKTRLDKVYKTGIIRSKPAFVNVRVMVVEGSNVNGVKLLTVQEEIIEVDGEEVSQIEVKEVVLELADKINESKRTITTIKVSQSKIHKKERKSDKHLWACKGRFPSNPFHANKKNMRKWKKMHYSHNKPPHFEMGKNRHGDSDERDDDDDDKHGKHHHHHHRYGRSWGHRFCRWFHKLPIATRVVFCISMLLLVTLMIASCCVCMCKKTKRQPAVVEKKYEMADSTSLESVNVEASPLPSKKSLDKQALIA